MAICPHCGREYYCANIDCPHCGKRIVNYFTINAFFRDNFHYFTIIGVIGTMIALLPTLGDKLVGNDWLSDQLSFLAASLVFLFIFGAMLLSGIFIILMKKIWSAECRFQESPINKSKKLNWLKKGDKSRLMISFCLLPMMFAIIGFLILVLFYTDNAIIQSISIIIITLILFVAYGYRISGSLLAIFLKNWKIGIITLLISIAIVSLVIFNPYSQTPPKPLESPHDVKIIASEQYYDPQLSPNKALILEATNTDRHIYGTNWMHWTTDYGFFVRTKPQNSKLEILGNDTLLQSMNTYSNQRIYWRYPSSDIGKEKHPVTITLTILTDPEKKIITNSTLNLNWTGTDIAVSSQN